MVSNDDIQAAIVAYLKSQSTVTVILGSSEEIRELEWQGTDFQYPAVRVSVDFRPSIDGCAPGRATVFLDNFSEQKSSAQSQSLAGAEYDVFHKRPFNQNGMHFSGVTVMNMPKANATIFGWLSSVEIVCLVN